MGMKKEKIMKGLKDFKKKFLVVTLVTAVTFSGINLPVTTVNAATAVAPSVLSFVEQDDRHAQSSGVVFREQLIMFTRLKAVMQHITRLLQ